MSKYSTVTVKVQKELKKKMNETDINWSDFIRESIQHRIQLGERRKTGEKLLKHLSEKRDTVPKGFINKTIRQLRETL
jgi:hypothetical protein